MDEIVDYCSQNDRSSISIIGVKNDRSSISIMPVTTPGEVVRQKILIHQVFRRCVQVWGRVETLSSIPHLPYPGKTWECLFRIDILPSKKVLVKDGERHNVTRGLRTG